MMGALAATRQLGPLAVGQAASASGTLEAVAWTNLAKCAVDAPNTLRRSVGTNDWTAGACSTRAILSGAGYFEMTLQSSAAGIACGLSNGDSGVNFTDIDYAMFVYAGTLYYSEKGTYVSMGACAVNDVLRVAVTAAGSVTYLKNGGLLRTAPVAATFPLLVDGSIFGPLNAVIYGAKIYGTLGASGY